MTDAISIIQVRHEGRLLYVLLDAAEANGTLRGTAVEARWREGKERVQDSGDFEGEAALYFELLSELAASGKLAGTWIEQRWLTIKTRIPAAA